MMKPSRAWLHVIRSDILSGVHRYPEIQYEDEPSLHGGAGAPIIQRAFYAPRKASVKLPLDLVVGESQAPSWPTFSPQSALTLVADVVLMDLCSKSRCHQEAEHAWLNVLANEGLL
eukprot:9005374-Lingulodinium_polyedra.AAC.1